ncbi:endonuclease V [Methermicoccus shengliensis]|uniref:Endonuclease V n=1 Tax=Methermicoccus shengliensis TaxID=660064 RepID=A0A832RW89_9EURY|nr:endonuclease V [Methermicoccus shengliensis]MDN5295813.1 deoxyribonuclease [Methanosarcinales archaeon]HIH69267.1 endonuclease V [Methermicoccus shengliensis]
MDEDVLLPSSKSKESMLKAQRLVREHVRLDDELGEVRRVGGVDCAYTSYNTVAACVVLDARTFKVVESAWAMAPTEYPYVPTFLAFRECRACARAVRSLEAVPDVLFVDGAGVNHPRMAGLASHLGVLLDLPTIGITKKVLCGTARTPTRVRQSHPLLYGGKVVGHLVLTKARCKPIVVAAGHRTTHERALALCLEMLDGHKLPAPIRLADAMCRQIKTHLNTNTDNERGDRWLRWRF